MPNKVRADQLVVSQGLAESRTRAQALILAGNVFAGDRRVAKAGDMLADDAVLTVKGRDHPWVSRGGI
jgi:23S rRNA (cytidine1920-2'-O)/16S rRNA (cytidine1409-2'-O)-methyltransferase